MRSVADAGKTFSSSGVDDQGVRLNLSSVPPSLFSPLALTAFNKLTRSV